MKPQQPRFIKSCLKPADYPAADRPEIAFIGRSNVGKSSLLNTLMSKRGLAKTSSTPGKTQTLNFFDIDGVYYFVDLPGYGYAKVPLAVKENWGKAILAYLQAKRGLALALQLLDSRHKPSQNDLDMLEILEEAEIPTLIVATKIDKLKRSQRKQGLDRIAKTLELDDEALIVPFSAVTGEGRKEIWHVIEDIARAGGKPAMGE